MDGRTDAGGAAPRNQCALSRCVEQGQVKPASEAAAATAASEGTMRKNEQRNGGGRKGDDVIAGGTVGHESSGSHDRGRRRKSSKAELFMKRLEGNRGPQNRRESIALFKRVLNDCPTANNSAQFRDENCGDYAHPESNGKTDSKNNVSPSSSGDVLVDSSKQAAIATEQAQKAAAVRALFAQREKSYQNLARLMGVESGSYMLGPEADHVKTSFGRRGHQYRSSSVGVVRVSSERVV